MRTHLEQDCEGVDAAIFSGDVLYDDAERAELKAYVERWTRALAEHEQADALTPRELELIDGMIEVQLHHAAQCDRIANRVMAEKQKGWDMERVALLRKLRAPRTPQPADAEGAGPTT